MRSRREWAMEPLYSTLGGDPDLGDLVTLFVEEMPDRVTNFLELFNRREWEDLRRAAHQIKGAAGSYGFGAISPYADELDYALREQEPEEIIRQRLQGLSGMSKRTSAVTPQA